MSSRRRSSVSGWGTAGELCHQAQERTNELDGRPCSRWWSRTRINLPLPNTNRPLPITCPKCQHEGSTLVVKSLSIMTVACATCGHTWATEMDVLPPDIQAKVRVVLEQGLE